jgi:hypothetical protein
VLIIIGVAALLSSVLFAWYTTQLSDNHRTIGETYGLSGVQLSGTQRSIPYAPAYTFTEVGLPTTGQLYAEISVAIVLSAVLGGLAVSLMLWRGPPSRRALASVVVILAAALSVSAPLLLVAAQPGALCSDSIYIPPPLALGSTPSSRSPPSCDWSIDTPSSSGSGYSTTNGGPPGPETSFIGSDVVQGANHTWGPSIGWFVALAGSSLVLAGAAIALGTGQSRADQVPDGMSTRGEDSPSNRAGPD